MPKFYFGNRPIRTVYYNGIKKVLSSDTKNGKHFIILKNANANKEKNK